MIPGNGHVQELCGDCPVPAEIHQIKARADSESQRLSEACASISKVKERLDNLVTQLAEIQISFCNSANRLEEVTKKIEEMARKPANWTVTRKRKRS